MSEEEVQELFFDEAGFHIGPWSAAITFGLAAMPPNVTLKPVLRVRMPLSLYKTLGIIISRSVRQYEERAHQTIELPDEVLNELGIAPDDWRRKGLEGFE